MHRQECLCSRNVSFSREKGARHSCLARWRFFFNGLLSCFVDSRFWRGLPGRELSMERRYEVRLQELLDGAVIDPEQAGGMLARLEQFVKPFAACVNGSRPADPNWASTNRLDWRCFPPSTGFARRRAWNSPARRLWSMRQKCSCARNGKDGRSDETATMAAPIRLGRMGRLA